MTTQKKLSEVLARHPIYAKAYRRYGKIRLAFQPHKPGGSAEATPERHREAVEAAAHAVATCTVSREFDWPEYPVEEMREWHRLGFQVRDVCDDPIPTDAQAKEAQAAWLFGQCRRYHFRLTLDGDGKLVPVADDGFSMDEIRKFLPNWFGKLCKEHLAELKVLAAKGDG